MARHSIQDRNLKGCRGGGQNGFVSCGTHKPYNAYLARGCIRGLQNGILCYVMYKTYGMSWVHYCMRGLQIGVLS